jgi:hypothetical protein
MKNEIKEIKNRAISYKVYDGELHKANFTAKEILTIIAEVESRETEIKQLQAVCDAREEYIKKLEDKIGKIKRQTVLHIAYYDTKIKQLKRDYKDHTEILGDKLNDQIEYGKQNNKKIKELEAKIKELDIGLVARTLLKQENEQLQAVRETAKELDLSYIINKLSLGLDLDCNRIKKNNNIIRCINKLQQALVVKGKDEKSQ